MSPPAGNAPGDSGASAGGRLLGTNSLQQSIDAFNAAVDKLTSAVSTMTQDIGNGMTSRPVQASQAQGARITTGSHNAVPAMGSWANQAVLLGGSQAAGGGANAGGATFSAPQQQSSGGGVRYGSSGGGSSPAATMSGQPQQSAAPATTSSTASGGGANAGGPNFGSVNGPVQPPTGFAGAVYRTIGLGSGGGGGGSFPPSGAPPAGGSGGSGGPGGPASSGGGTSFGGAAIQAAFTTAGAIGSAGGSAMNSMLAYNAYGAQMSAQWGGNPAVFQNNAFGYYNTGINNAAQGSPQQATAEWTQINSMTGGGTLGYGSMLGATNALAYANTGLGAGAAAGLASQIYNPQNAMMMQMLTGVSAINRQTGQDNSLSSIITGLAQKGFIGGGGFNAATGTFNQSKLDASFTAGRGTSYMNLQSLGYSQSDIADIQAAVSQANQAAVKGHTSVQDVMNLMNTAEGGPGIGEPQIQAAQSQLNKMGIKQSTIQQLGNLQSQGMAQQQGESSTYNAAVQDFTDVMKQATNAMSAFLNKTGLGKLAGAGMGIAGGYSATGLSGWVSKLLGLGSGGLLGGITGMIGGGAASVSTGTPMGSASSASPSARSTQSSGIPNQAKTAVRDAEREVGTPYVYGGASPQTGFDCSGLVQWAYGQAGVHLPRTSQQQWSALRSKSIPLDQVREGDIVFAAGADGTAASPGHEALMVSSKEIVEAPHTGADIRTRAFSPGEWQHAARPVGGMTSLSTGKLNTSAITAAGQAVASSVTALQGNRGSAIGGGGGGGGGDADLGLVSNTDDELLGGGTVGAAPGPGTPFGGTGAAGTAGGTGTGSANASGPGSSSKTFSGGGNSMQNEQLAKKMAQSLYGWSGSQWSEGLFPLWTQESGFQTTATNPQSGAYGIPQALPASKMASAGSDYRTDPQTQIKWGLSYIKARYGSPLQAEAHEKAFGWYGSGAMIVGERGPEMFVPTQPGELHSAAQTASLLRGTSAQPGASLYTATPTQQYTYDPATPAGSASRNGVTVSLGGITVNAPNMTGTTTTSDTQVLAQLILAQVESALSKSKLVSDIAAGNTG